MQAATRMPTTRFGGGASASLDGADGAHRPTDARRARAERMLGGLGLLGVLSAVLLLTAGAATRPSQYVPARSGGWPGWMAGPLEGLGVGITRGGFQAL